MDGTRFLVVTADDYGIGPATSRGILDLAAAGLVTSTVLLVNSPYAAEGVRHWQHAGRRPELGWHPCLTLDRPLLPPERVPSLVRSDGSFWPLGAFIRRLCSGKVRAEDIAREFEAQCGRFEELTGQRPPVVNTHHHVQVFPPVGRVLLEVLARRGPMPYLRRVREPWSTLARVPGARVKRLALSLLGRRDARSQEAAGCPGNGWLAGITDPPCVADPDFLVRWLARVPGRVVELTCHPGYLDTTLLGRDATPHDGQLQRRVGELHLLRQPSFHEACHRAGFTLVAPSQLGRASPTEESHAA